MLCRVSEVSSGSFLAIWRVEYGKTRERCGRSMTHGVRHALGAEMVSSRKRNNPLVFRGLAGDIDTSLYSRRALFPLEIFRATDSVSTLLEILLRWTCAGSAVAAKWPLLCSRTRVRCPASAAAFLWWINCGKTRVHCFVER